MTTEMLDDDNVIYTTLSKINPETIRAVTDYWRLVRERWPLTHILYTATDFAGFTGAYLSLGLSEVRSALQNSPKIIVYNAVVVPHNTVGKLIEFTIRTTRVFNKQEYFQLFSSRDDAIRWLHIVRKQEERKQATIERNA